MAVKCIDGMTDLLSLHAANRLRYPYLLQTHGDHGWDILFAFPLETFSISASEFNSESPAFLDLLDSQWCAAKDQNAQQDTSLSALPFSGGWFVYMGYELLHQIESAVAGKTLQSDFPVACLTRIPSAIMVNRETRQTFLFAEEGHEECLHVMQRDLNSTSTVEMISPVLKVLIEDDAGLFLDGVTQIKRYILDGDVFQVNLSREWHGELESGMAADLYASLRQHNPAPFSGIADFGAYQIVSSSPERLVSVDRAGVVQTRPIAGTYARSADAQQDEQLRRDLLSHPKERAEHVMLVDLERNDLGRICVPGSVEVDDLMAVKTYAHVHHIESNVRGKLRKDVTPGSVLRALFPGGTITGCPKVRTMQIICELEQTPRLAYTGSMGYLNHDGSMDMNILIRSFMLNQKQFRFRAGAGIVADSVPEKELNETRAKAKGLLKALAS